MSFLGLLCKRNHLNVILAFHFIVKHSTPAGCKVLLWVPEEEAGLLLPEEVPALRVQGALPLRETTHKHYIRFDVR